MLIEFRVENHRSLRDEQALTMEAGRVGDESDPRPREVEGHSARALPVAALYGANASGKSNVLDALGFMRAAVVRSHRMWLPEGGVPREPFAWGESAAKPSLFEVTLLLNGVRYEYGFVADDEQFREEWLYAYPRGRRQVWFEREEGRFKFGESLRGENRLIEQITRPNALFLSAAAQHRHEQLAPLYEWFYAIRAVNVAGYRRGAPELDPDNAFSWLSTSSGEPSPVRVGHRSLEVAMDIDILRQILRAADVGIVDVKVVREPKGQGRGFALRHQSAEGEAWLPLEAESQGTRTLFQMAPSLWQALAHGSVLLVDELEASLHPLLALQILHLFNDPETNPNNAQLLFTTHDTNLLGNLVGEPPLRRDQVWLTEKDPEGATCLYPLTDYKPRKEENLERGYLQGRYGAIPFLGRLALVKAVS